MDNEINSKLDNSAAIASLLSSQNFVNLDPNLQEKIIDTVYNDKGKDGGVMGKFLGTKSSNAAMHIGFIICVILLIIILVDLIHSYISNKSANSELLNLFVPVITLFLGYIFGKGTT